MRPSIASVTPARLAAFGPAAAVLAVQLVLFPIGAGAWTLGLVGGLLTALVAIGLALVHRANRIVNFAQGDLGTVPTIITVGIVSVNGLPWLFGTAVGIASALVLGAVAEFGIVRRFRNAPRLLLTVATIGLSQLLVVVGLLLPRWWGRDLFVDQRLPQPFGASFGIGSQTFRAGEILTLVTVPIILAVLATMLRRTDLGIAIRASAERDDRAAALGIPVRRIRTVVWAIASLLSFWGLFLHTTIFGVGLAGTMSVQALLFALGALILGRLDDLPAVAVSAVALRVLAQGVTRHHPNTPGRVYLMLAVVILVTLLLRRASRQRADHGGVSSWSDTGQLRPIPAELRDLPIVRSLTRLLPIVLVAVAAIGPIWLSASNVLLLARVVIMALIVLSVTILTGWAGQVSLGQMSFVAVGAVAGAIATSTWGLDIGLALLVAGTAGAVVAVIVGLPAMRLPGLHLAVTTLAFALACSNHLLNRDAQSWIPRGAIDRPVFLGRFSLDGQLAMYEFVLAVVALSFLAVVGIRSSRTGRALAAVRDNDRAAGAFSISPLRAKTTAFALSGFVAAVAGCLLVHVDQTYTELPYVAQESLIVFTAAVVGGLGSWTGPILGALYLIGGTHFLPDRLELLPTGVGVLIVLLTLPNGLAALLHRVRDAFLRWIAVRRGLIVPSLIADEGGDDRAPAVRAPEFRLGPDSELMATAPSVPTPGAAAPASGEGDR